MVPSTGTGAPRGSELLLGAQQARVDTRAISLHLLVSMKSGEDALRNFGYGRIRRRPNPILHHCLAAGRDQADSSHVGKAA